MKNSTRRVITSALVGASCLLATTSGWSATFNLTAKAFTKTLDLPAGPRDVLMWGFALNGGTATSPGPALTVPPGDSTLTIILTNELPEPVSIVIPNQNGYVRTGTAEFTTGDPYAAGRPGPARPRALSFVKEAAPASSATYTWNNVTPGTYLYYSGSHSALQVQMGLYGMMKKNSSAVLAYANVTPPAGKPALPVVLASPFAQEHVWIFGEIDLAVHDAIAAGTYQSNVKSMIHAVPDIFLLNGEPFTIGQITTPSGSPPAALIRMLNACFDERIPVFNGYHVTVVAEDGRRFTYLKRENAVNLPAMKTRDIQLAAPGATVVKYFDRRSLSPQ